MNELKRAKTLNLINNFKNLIQNNNEELNNNYNLNISNKKNNFIKKTKAQQKRDDFLRLKIKKKENEIKIQEFNNKIKKHKENYESKKLSKTLNNTKSVEISNIGLLIRKDHLKQQEKQWKEWLILKHQELTLKQTNLSKIIGDNYGLNYENISFDDEIENINNKKQTFKKKNDEKKELFNKTE